jgi:hemolysin-activating ACP:hemolysin acyltransferase
MAPAFKHRLTLLRAAAAIEAEEIMSDTPVADQRPQRAAPMAGLHFYIPGNPQVALGLAVNHLMTKPAFANLRFGEWSRILVGQINRRHYAFVIDSERRVVGFAGWGLTTRDKAEAWVEGKCVLTYQDSLAGECLVFNCWSADNLRVHRFMVDEARRRFVDRQTMYFKRVYEDGTSRPVRLNVNEFVDRHIKRKSSG